MPTTVELAARYREVRAESERLRAPLSAEDCQAQSMPDASPVKWHLAHTTWFFETFVLEAGRAGYRPYHPAFRRAPAPPDTCLTTRGLPLSAAVDYQPPTTAQIFVARRHRGRRAG